ncbi:MAG: hypothetical protein AB8G23_01445 [Myxococcota bacterium]
MLAKRLFLIPVAFYVFWLVFDYEYHFLDGVNLLFHEGGHVFLALLGTTFHFLGGTIGQLFFPVACGVHFLQQRKFFETSLMGIWFAESLMNTARYLGDAVAQSLPLVGGHIHDWNWLLSRWGMLEYCESIAAGLHGFASLIAFVCLGWAVRTCFPADETKSAGEAFTSPAGSTLNSKS